MANSLADVQDTFTSLDAQYNTLRVACQTDEDLNALDAQYVQAQKNYWACVDQSLEDDDATVASLDKDLKADNEQIKKAVTFMGNMSKVIDVVTDAVKIGGSLMKLAGL